MNNIFKIALRNLFRYKRRTLLTSSLIAAGIMVVIVFSGLSSSFKASMISVITDSTLSHLQVHKKGYVESIENIPLTIYMTAKEVQDVQTIFKKQKNVDSFSPRIKFGGMVSNYLQTSNVRITAVFPDMEDKVCPALTKRIKGIKNKETFISSGEIIVPDIIKKGLNVNIGDELVIIATNRTGAVNAMPFKIVGILEGTAGPQSKDCYIHINDAQNLLMMEEPEISEIAVRVNDFKFLKSVYSNFKKDTLDGNLFEIHTWEELSPFSSISKIVDLLNMMVKVILMFIVLVSILNIIVMSVYERTSEIGTIGAIGTPPNKILGLFLAEGLSLGIISSVIGVVTGVFIIIVLNIIKISFKFGVIDLVLSPSIPVKDIFMVVFVVVIISILASLQPAYKASRLEPVDALRNV